MLAWPHTKLNTPRRYFQQEEGTYTYIYSQMGNGENVLYPASSFTKKK